MCVIDFLAAGLQGEEGAEEGGGKGNGVCSSPLPAAHCTALHLHCTARAVHAIINFCMSCVWGLAVSLFFSFSFSFFLSSFPLFLQVILLFSRKGRKEKKKKLLFLLLSWFFFFLGRGFFSGKGREGGKSLE